MHQVTRELVQLMSTDAQKLQRFRDAADMLSRVKAADYPRRCKSQPCRAFSSVQVARCNAVSAETLILHRRSRWLSADCSICRELQWLVSTCWNRGCHHATFERPDTAVAFMEVGLQLLEFCPELLDRKVRAVPHATSACFQCLEAALAMQQRRHGAVTLALKLHIRLLCM